MTQIQRPIRHTGYAIEKEHINTYDWTYKTDDADCLKFQQLVRNGNILLFNSNRNFNSRKDIYTRMMIMMIFKMRIQLLLDIFVDAVASSLRGGRSTQVLYWSSSTTI